MPVATQVVEVPLPAGVEPTPEEIELLTATLQAMVALRHERGRQWPALRKELEADGWTIDARLGWCVEARRGRDCERAFGLTREAAYEELGQLARLDDASGGAP